MSDNYFKELYDIDVRGKTKEKNGLSYLPWAAAWAEVKKKYPTATYYVHEDTFHETHQTETYTKDHYASRPWFTDARSGWVKVSVVIAELEHTEMLPIMDFKNKPIPADSITAFDANKAIQRALTKACARHGIGLYLYEGEDLPEESKELEKLKAEVWKLFCDRAKLSDEAKEKANEVCKKADASGDPRLIESVETLKQLKKELIAIRK